MRKAISSITALVVIVGLCISPARAQVVSDIETDAIKQDVSRLYSTTSKKVLVRLKNGSKDKGYIAAVGSDTFTLRNGITRMEIRYSNVASVTRTGLSKNQETALLIGAGVAVVAIVAVFGRKKRSGGFNPPCLLC
ncbi:MAG: hypothetical protein PSX80_08490 [bacterium]|nr:hypothetical protein [bacterium]